VFEFSDLPRPIIRHLNGLWRRRWTVIAVAWVVALAGWFAVWMIPDKYESRAHVFVQTETILEPVLNGFTARPDYSRRVEVMRLQLLTRPNVEEVILRAGMDRTIEARSDIERRTKMEALINELSEKIKIDSPREMYFVITYKNANPEMARAVVDAVLNMLIEQDLGATLSESEAAVRRLNLQIEAFEEKLTANERAVANYRRANASELAGTLGAVRRREQKEQELARASDELERTEGRIFTLKNLMSTTSRTTSGGELDKLKVELADLRSRYKETHPDIRGVAARIAQLEAGGAALSSNPDYVRLRSELQLAQNAVGILGAREQRLRRELEALDLTAGLAPAAEAGLQQIIREYEQTQKTYGELLLRRDRLQLTRNLGAAGRGVDYQVFERPEAALAPTDPPRMLLIIGVFGIAAGAGAGAAWLLTMLDKSYTQLSELQDAFGLPVLGALSEVPSPAVVAARYVDLRKLGAVAASLMLVGAAYSYVAVLKLPSEAADAEISASANYGEAL
jgi:protein tyrosine kinase modulator